MLILVISMADLTITIDLHYFMKDKDLHDMDASINHKCGQSLVNVINHLGEVFDEDVQVDITAIDKGGFKDIYKVIVKDVKSEAAFIALLSCLLAHFIGVAPSLDETQKQLNRVEIVTKIKEGDFTEDDINFVITGDPKYIKNRNDFYTLLDKEPNVSKVAYHATTISNSGENRSIPDNFIEKKDFESQIIKKEAREIVDVYEKCYILVTSPILMQGHRAGWRGIINNQPITFSIEDKVFLKKVYRKEVTFVVGTTLICDLEVKSETKFDEFGHELNSDKKYSVFNVVSFTDKNEIPQKERQYHDKNKASKTKQTSLFDNPDFFE